MEWFIVAIVYIVGEKQPQWAQMDMPFQTRELCQQGGGVNCFWGVTVFM